MRPQFDQHSRMKIERSRRCSVRRLSEDFYGFSEIESNYERTSEIGTSVQSCEMINLCQLEHSIRMYCKTFSNGIPAATYWSCSEVSNYFRGEFGDRVAFALKFQEMDGIALMLTKRKDLIHGIGMNIGTVLKLFAAVEKLQGVKTEN